MDDIVKQAMAKWPNVPHCYGWLALDARGNWRMRDERAQALNLPGERIINPALLGFICRNYTSDERGQWYFQNGPQRVYVNLEATPYIARTEPAQGFVLHTGTPLTAIEGVWLTESGQLLLKKGEVLALLDDRDMGECLSSLHIGDISASDEQLLNWLQQPNDTELSFNFRGTCLPVRHMARDAIATEFRFIMTPQPDSH